ncbi:MAG: hypothetical protein NKF70_00230 [Methanobacterium sp. ERen5]|nr:MAG: hypothetical protein NKF70_00230 [Methanobacterium sp. ERen5]
MENSGTDRDILHFISEHPELGDLLTKLEDELTTKTLKWRNDRKLARIDIVSKMRDKGLHGDYEGIKRYLKVNITGLQIRGDILGRNGGTKKGRCCGF